MREGYFCFAFDVRPGQEAEAEALRPEWSEEKKDYNTTEQHGNSVSDMKSKESDILVVEDY